MQAKANDADEFLTERQLSALVKVHDKTLKRLRLSGDGPRFIRVGKARVIYRRADVDAWLNARTFEHRAAEAIGLIAA